MKWLIVAINLIVLANSIAAIARQEKIIKKPHGLKPTKAPKTIIEQFRNLSPEDVEFIKQVDKQFKVHGDKIKIKVERENSTAVVNKNTKRTIDGSLGYAYHQNQNQHGYYFSQPHMMHQFTMRDVPHEKNIFREKATDIEIQQSHSFEIKEQEASYTPRYQPSASQQSYQHEQVYEDPVPVIVLRIPGPQKYALHLQALLQQYLEIRAAQFIKALEEQERHGQLMHAQHYGAPQHQQYIPMISITPMYQQQQFYHQQQQQQQQQPQHGFQQYYQVHHGNSYQVPAGEQSYYQQPAVHQPSVQEYHQQVIQDYQSAQEYQQPPAEPEYQRPTEQEFHHGPTVQYQQEFPTSYINFVTPAYDQGDLHQGEHHDHNEEPLQTSENYPSDKHTHVIFKKKKNRVRPSISYHKAQPIVVADPSAHEHHEQEEAQYQHQAESVQHSEQSEHASYAYTNNHNEYSAQAEVVAVTQRSHDPVNYHVIQPTLAPTHEEVRDRHNPKRMAPFTKEQFEKARRMMMSKSKKTRGSMRQEEMMKRPAGPKMS